MLEKGVSRRDLCASILLKLANLAPLAMVVDSGGKSLHGWFRCKGVDQECLSNFFTKATSLGADPMTWNPCQLVRLPWGVRDTGKPQEVLFFNSDNVVKL
jgi:hypothetical protein